MDLKNVMFVLLKKIYKFVHFYYFINALFSNTLFDEVSSHFEGEEATIKGLLQSTLDMCYPTKC